MRALITGISGQDGSYLAEYLLLLGYEVYGIVRRNSVYENQEARLENVQGRVGLFYGDVLDVASLYDIFRKVRPDEVYNLAAQSHVRISSDVPVFTVQVNAVGALNVLEATRQICPSARFYQASSSEMFGNSMDSDRFQRESTTMNPVSPYGCSKLLAYSLVRHYRKSYEMFAVNGILFNHESPRRGSDFVTNKVVKTAVRIKCGLEKKLELGNLDSYRDWGHAKDYVRAMHMMLNHNEPNDFVVATGKAHSVRDLCEYVFDQLGLDYREFVVQNPALLRPEELSFLRGDAALIRATLGWQPEYAYEQLLNEMIEYWKDRYK